jgi:hypothetical protein
MTTKMHQQIAEKKEVPAPFQSTLTDQFTPNQPQQRSYQKVNRKLCQTQNVQNLAKMD